MQFLAKVLRYSGSTMTVQCEASPFVVEEYNTPVINPDEYGLSTKHVVNLLRIPIDVMRLFDADAKLFGVQGKCSESVEVLLVTVATLTPIILQDCNTPDLLVPREEATPMTFADDKGTRTTPPSQGVSVQDRRKVKLFHT